MGYELENSVDGLLAWRQWHKCIEDSQNGFTAEILEGMKLLVGQRLGCDMRVESLAEIGNSHGQQNCLQFENGILWKGRRKLKKGTN